MEKGISKEGVQFYHDLIDELLKNGHRLSLTLYIHNYIYIFIYLS